MTVGVQTVPRCWCAFECVCVSICLCAWVRASSHFHSQFAAPAQQTRQHQTPHKNSQILRASSLTYPSCGAVASPSAYYKNLNTATRKRTKTHARTFPPQTPRPRSAIVVPLLGPLIIIYKHTNRALVRELFRMVVVACFLSRAEFE